MTALRPDCEHRWVLYGPPRQPWWRRRREWTLACYRCGGSTTCPSKAEAIARMSSNDWGRPRPPRPLP